MCLSTAYKDHVDDNAILMKNVMSVEYIKDHIDLTDLMERKMEVEGQIEFVSLTDNYLIIKTGK